MSSQPSPHDAVFRRILGEPANAASQLRAVLPASLVDQLDLDQLIPVPASFVDTDLRWPFRILRYLLRIWDRWLADHPKVEQLPVVIPLVVHHNRQPWRGPTQLRELFDLDPDSVETFGEYLPQLRFLLDDLAGLDVQALMARPVSPPVRITLLLLKTAAGNPRLAKDLASWADDLRAILQQPGGLEQFRALLSYIEIVGEAPTDELEDLLTQLGPEAEEAYVTTAEVLRAEGRANALVQLLTIKFGPLPQAALDTVHAASTDQLETWTARVLTADGLEEVLR